MKKKKNQVSTTEETQNLENQEKESIVVVENKNEKKKTKVKKQKKDKPGIWPYLKQHKLGIAAYIFTRFLALVASFPPFFTLRWW